MSSIEETFTKIRADLILIKWMTALNLALIFVIFIIAYW